MSATNRGSTRKPHDFYPTPISTIETFLDVFPLRGGIEVLEPVLVYDVHFFTTEALGRDP